MTIGKEATKMGPSYTKAQKRKETYAAQENAPQKTTSAKN